MRNTPHKPHRFNQYTIYNCWVMIVSSVDDGDHIQDALMSMTGRHTVPQVFFNGRFIGGCNGTF